MLHLIIFEQPKPDFIQEYLIYDSSQREDIYCTGIWSYFCPLLLFFFSFGLLHLQTIVYSLKFDQTWLYFCL